MATPEPASAPAGKSAEDYVRQFGGLTSAYRSILAETDCAKLGDLFVTANDNHKLGLVVATDDRMRAIGCG
jgi:hypothetical protein